MVWETVAVPEGTGCDSMVMVAKFLSRKKAFLYLREQVFQDPQHRFFLSSIVFLHTHTSFPVVAGWAGQGGMVPQTKLHLLDAVILIPCICR